MNSVFWYKVDVRGWETYFIFQTTELSSEEISDLAEEIFSSYVQPDGPSKVTVTLVDYVPKEVIKEMIHDSLNEIQQSIKNLNILFDELKK